jgi:trehalose/maltose transport system substrate-binding protein
MKITLTKLVAGTALAFGATAIAHAATITISCGNNAADVEFCGKFAEDWGKKNGHTVKMYTPPASTTDNLALLRQQFERHRVSRRPVGLSQTGSV